MVARLLEDIATVNGVGLAAPNATDRLLVNNTAVPDVGKWKDIAVGEISAFAPGGASGIVPRFDVKKFASFQAAVDSGLPIFVPAGTYNIPTLEIPAIGCSIYGSGVDTTIISCSTANQPVFRWRHGTDIGDWRLGTNLARIELQGLHLAVRFDANSQAQTRHNCPASGLGVGPPAILIERSNFPTGTGVTAPGLCHLPAFMRFQDLVFRKVGVENANNFSPNLMLQGSAPGAYIHNLQSQDPNHSIIMGPPFVRRCTTSGGRIVPVGGNPFVNGQSVVIRVHGESGGVLPAGVNESTTFAVINADSTGFRLQSGEIVITAGDGGKCFAILVGNAMGEYAQEGQWISAITGFVNKSSWETSNSVGSLWSGLTSYAAHHVFRVDSLDSAGTDRSENTALLGLYSESPQFASGPAQGSEPLIGMDGDGMVVSALQIRGSESGVRPFLRFTGSEHHLTGLHGRSNFGAQDTRQPAYQLEAVNSFVTGNNHAGGTVTAADARGRVRKDSATGNHLNNLASW